MSSRQSYIGSALSQYKFRVTFNSILEAAAYVFSPIRNFLSNVFRSFRPYTPYPIAPMAREPLAQMSSYPGQDREQRGKLIPPDSRILSLLLRVLVSD